jgi:hypothetical protein
VAKGKSFAVGSLLREKKPSEAEVSPTREHDGEPPVEPAASSGLADEALDVSDSQTGSRSDETSAFQPAASGTRIPQTERRRPGPKGRGLYKKRTLDLPLDLDNFVEHARRSHVRPNGQPSTAYTHFIEDLIAAERDRRAKR